MFYRGLTGAVVIYFLARSRGIALTTKVPATHFWRSLSGVTSMFLWFSSLAGLPLATAMTLNYMSSVWMALFLIGGAAMLGGTRIDGRLIFTVLLGFAGVALILRPTIAGEQLWYGVIGLLSGIISATAYLQVAALARAGEPEERIVFYFSLGGSLFGLVTTFWSGVHAHTWLGSAELLGVGVSATAAQLMMTRAYAIGSAMVNASLQYLGIAFSFGYGVLLFADRVSWMALGGMLLIVGAGLCATLLRSRTAGSVDTAAAPLESS